MFSVLKSIKPISLPSDTYELDKTYGTILQYRMLYERGLGAMITISIKNYFPQAI